MLMCFCGTLYGDVEEGCPTCNEEYDRQCEQLEKEIVLECTGA